MKRAVGLGLDLGGSLPQETMRYRRNSWPTEQLNKNSKKPALTRVQNPALALFIVARNLDLLTPK